MLRELGIAGACGAAAALVVAVLEAWLGGPVSARSFAAAAGLALMLLLPLGIALALGLVALRALLPERLRPAALLQGALAQGQRHRSAAVLAVGVVGLLGLPAAYRLIHLGMTKFHNKELAALALLAALVALAAALGVAGLALYRALRALLAASAPWTSGMERPVVAAALMLGAWCGALLPPLLEGPNATGAFGFVGLLRMDGLGAMPLVSALCLLGLCAALLLSSWRYAKGRGVLLGGVGCLVVGLASPLVASRAASHDLGRTVVERSAGLGATLLSLGRRLSDRDKDGHGRAFGGRDCDDRNPRVHPGAQDAPDNGIDEDCSGADLRLADLREALGTSPQTDRAPDTFTRPALPEDVSVVLVTLDAWRADAAGFMGNPRPLSPNLDALAAQGVVYERAYALASFTGHSVPAMMTGKWTSELLRTSAHEIRVLGEETFAAELICAQGVRCGAFLPHFLFKPSFGWHQGFHDWQVITGEPAAEENVHNRTTSQELTRRAVAWLKETGNTAGRFFLWVHYFDPHREYLAHDGFASFGEDRRARYDHEVLFTDHHVGLLLAALRDIGASSRTIVIVTGDHGEGFQEHGSFAHGKELWEELLRVPLIVVGPGVAKKRLGRVTSHIDIFPTLLELFGVPIDGGVHGKSLLPDWVEGQELPARPIVADQPHTPYFEMRRSYAEGELKLIHSAETGSLDLYRWDGAPESPETLNESHPAQLERMKAAYELFVATQLKGILPVDE